MNDEVNQPLPAEPAPAEQPQGQVPQVDEFDTTAEQGELDALNAEIEQGSANIKGNFAAFAAQNTTPEMETLFFEDKEAFYAQLLDMFNQFYAENVGAKQERAGGLSRDIDAKNAARADKAAAQEFEAAHPEIKINDLLIFYEEMLPPKLRAELDSANLPPEQFYEVLLNLFQQFQAGAGAAQGGGQGEQPLPQEINGAAAPASSVQGGGENFLPTARM